MKPTFPEMNRLPRVTATPRPTERKIVARCVHRSIGVMRFAALLALTTTCNAGETRTWTTRAGETFAAQIVACDAIRATLDVTGRGKVVPLDALSAPDIDLVHRWRTETPVAPLIDPGCLPPWPTQAIAEGVRVQSVENDAAGDLYTWESAHFGESARTCAFHSASCAILRLSWKAHARLFSLPRWDCIPAESVEISEVRCRWPKPL
jgi:hypothetical protein